MLTKINEYISYIEPTEDPLSANACIIEGKDFIWLFDVGNNPVWIDTLNSLNKPKNVILSHFHPDHIGNLQAINYSTLYVGKNTFKYTKTGEIVENDLFIKDGALKLHLIPLSSSHAKGSLGLEVNEEFLFLGDAAYSTMKAGKRVYNAQLLLELIHQIEASPANTVLLSHENPFCKDKSVLLDELKSIYNRHDKNNPYIAI